MPDGAAPPAGGDPADARALATDNRLIRGVRWRLVLWSGLTTLVVLALLGVALYVVAARTLESDGIKQLATHADIARAVGVYATPFFIIDGEVIAGFDKERLTELLTGATPPARASSGIR